MQIPYLGLLQAIFSTIELQQVHQWEVEDVVVAWPNLSFALLHLVSGKVGNRKHDCKQCKSILAGGLLSANVRNEFTRTCKDYVGAIAFQFDLRLVPLFHFFQVPDKAHRAGVG